MTNETVMAYTFVGFPNIFANPSAVDRTTVGYNYTGLFNNGVKQIPSFGNFGPSEAALVFNPGGFEDGGASEGLYANKWMPSVSDTFDQGPQRPHDQGRVLLRVDPQRAAGKQQYQWRGVGVSQQPIQLRQRICRFADRQSTNGYTETNFNRVNDINYGTTEFFVQDSWKATRKLTFEFGMRFTHFQPWIDGLGDGYSIFVLSEYNPSCAASPTYCGFEWHKKDAAVPVGGFPTRALFYQPRLGAAYDIIGHRQNGASGRLGPLLLPFRPVYQRA